jgi:hypothetical protein
MTKNEIKLIKRPSKPSDVTQTPELATALGNIRVRMTAIIIAGILALVLLSSGLVAIFTNHPQAKDFWLIIGPIISGAVSGLIGFEIGQKTKDQ